jgi:hypothetical protein
MKVQDERPAEATERPIGKHSKLPIFIVIAAPITGVLLWILMVSVAPLILK